jgi:hypothetical protein
VGNDLPAGKSGTGSGKGAVKEAAGKLTGDAKLKAEGKTDKAAGKVQSSGSWLLPWRIHFDRRHVREAFFDQWIPTFHKIALDGVQLMSSNSGPSDQEFALSFIS